MVSRPFLRLGLGLGGREPGTRGDCTVHMGFLIKLLIPSIRLGIRCTTSRRSPEAPVPSARSVRQRPLRRARCSRRRWKKEEEEEEASGGRSLRRKPPEGALKEEEEASEGTREDTEGGTRIPTNKYVLKFGPRTPPGVHPGRHFTPDTFPAALGPEQGPPRSPNR